MTDELQSTRAEQNPGPAIEPAEAPSGLHLSTGGSSSILLRLRLTYAKGEPLKYISHLDLARAWERIFRRAGLPLAHSQGFNPRPRFQIASGLPVGVAGRAELMDLWLAGPLSPLEVLSRLRAALPPGLEVLEAALVDLRMPALQAQVRAADYRAAVRTAETENAIRARVAALLAAPSLPRRRHHKGEWQTYDLRPLVHSIKVEPAQPGVQILSMRLQASPAGAGRPDEVLDALGLLMLPHSIERTRLYFE
jgi:radical SAM-linked protein